jgi:hypothetical protein
MFFASEVKTGGQELQSQSMEKRRRISCQSNGVKPHRQPLCLVLVHHLAQPLLHLRGSLVGEGDALQGDCNGSLSERKKRYGCSLYFVEREKHKSATCFKVRKRCVCSLSSKNGQLQGDRLFLGDWKMTDSSLSVTVKCRIQYAAGGPIFQ